MREPETKFELPKKLEKIFASLSAYYARNKKLELQRILVNSSYRVQEEWTYDNWDGGTYGHAIYFNVPALIYYEVFDRLAEISRELSTDISRVANVQNEYIAEVFLELQDDPELTNWREHSGALVYPVPAEIIYSQDQLKFWTPGCLRMFLSHKTEYKKETVQFKDAMANYQVSCFVAHEDIEPTKKWQDEIEKALFTMDVLVALMTPDFANSKWTDQEVGVAIGRGVPVIPIRLGLDPYGFIGKYQGVSVRKKGVDDLAKKVYDLLWEKEVLKQQMKESLITRFENAVSYVHANDLMELISKHIVTATPQMIERLEKAPKENMQLRNAFRVKSDLAPLILRLRGKFDESSVSS